MRINVRCRDHLSNGAQGPAPKGLQEGRADCNEGHHCRQRVAGQPDDEAAVRQLRQDGRVARPHCDAIHQQLSAERLDGCTKVICPGTAGSPGGYGYVWHSPREGVRARQRSEPFGVGIPDPQRAGNCTSKKGNDRTQLWTENVADAAWFRNARRDQFGTGQYDSDNRLGLNRKVVVSSHGGKGNVSGIQCCAGSD